ncbi:MAG: hypothetical protein V7K75_03210 [Nostoc sp.]
MSSLFNNLAQQVTQEAKNKGLVIHLRSRIKYSVIFRNIEIPSPYLWDKTQHQGISPVKEKLGIKTGERSPLRRIAIAHSPTTFDHTRGVVTLRRTVNFFFNVKAMLIKHYNLFTSLVFV